MNDDRGRVITSSSAVEAFDRCMDGTRGSAAGGGGGGGT